jgi:hypothetical protein
VAVPRGCPAHRVLDCMSGNGAMTEAMPGIPAAAVMMIRIGPAMMIVVAGGAGFMMPAPVVRGKAVYSPARSVCRSRRAGKEPHHGGAR